MRVPMQIKRKMEMLSRFSADANEMERDIVDFLSNKGVDKKQIRTIISMLRDDFCTKDIVQSLKEKG